MNPRTLIKFFQRPAGKFLGFVLLVVLVLGLLYGCTSRIAKSIAPDVRTAAGGNDYQPKSITRSLEPVEPTRPPKPTGVVTSTPPPALVVAPNPDERTVVPRIGLHASAPVPPTEPEVSDNYLPFGRQLRCVLVVTVDSSRQAVPIIGLVTEDACHDGRVIVPKGTEVHGRTQSERVRDRIFSDSSWTLVWQSGEEISVNGVALNQEKDPSGRGWGLTDGSPGLAGEVIRADPTAEAKLFGAALLRGATGVFEERDRTMIGREIAPNLRNGALEGGKEVLNTYAQQIAETIARENTFVRVAAGKEFYLYVTQSIDRPQARRGGHRSRPEVNRVTPTVPPMVNLVPNQEKYR